MFNVVIIDDENFIIKSLETSIQWKELNLQVTATFSNGQDAFNYIEQHPVHILITDIRMPGISGLDLCQYLDIHFPHIQTIIMSGYADFVYAQKALLYNVLGYCVKPLDFHEMTLLLKKAIHTLNQSGPNTQDILTCIEDEEYTLLTSYLEQHQLNPNHFFLAASIGLQPLSHILQCPLTLRIGVHKYLYFLSQPCKTLPTLDDLIHYSIKGLGIYPDAISIPLLKETIHYTLLMGYQYFIVGSPYICQSLPTPIHQEQLSQLQNHLNTHHLGSLQTFLDQLLEPSQLQSYTVNFALKLYHLFITHYMTYSQIDLDDLYIYSVDSLVNQFENISQMLTRLYDLLCEQTTSDHFPTSYNNNFITILQFINHNYTKDISIKDISKQLNLNPSYISQLFKKETGSTYVKYLTQLRIEKAKDLLQNTNFSLSEICDQIGYNDYFYFLKTFKKYEGMSPSKYRMHLTS